MYFGFDSEQLAFRDAVRDLLDKDCPPEAVRAAWQAPPGRLDRTVWDHLAAMGVLGVLVPEADAGLGLDERSLVLILEEAGRAALPHPVAETAAVAARLPAAAARASAGALVASDLGGPNVVCAADADALLLVATDASVSRSVARSRDGSGHRTGAWTALYLAEPGAVRLTPVDTLDGARRAARVGWSPSDATLVTDDPDEIDRAFDRGAWATAAQLVGLGQRMLDITVTYVDQREQFGQRVGAFQAVKHHLADALKELAFARPAVHRAAHSLAVDAPTRARDVSMAKAMAAEAAWFVGRQALQCHGAIGYTVEGDLHLYLKRTWALAKSWGDAAWHRDRVGTALGI
ncbi:MAG: acyl-CoA dehydrogenase family protein [Acidimicrobiales bacterium]